MTWLDFGGQKVKCEGHSRPKYVIAKPSTSTRSCRSPSPGFLAELVCSKLCYDWRSGITPTVPTVAKAVTTRVWQTKEVAASGTTNHRYIICTLLSCVSKQMCAHVLNTNVFYTGGVVAQRV